MKRNLTNIAVKNAKPKPDGKPLKVTDGGGLYLLVKLAGKYWRYDYRYLGKRKTLAIGVYDDLSLSDARKIHEEAREQLAKGIDPNDEKRRDKIKAVAVQADTFQAVADEWFLRNSVDWSKSYIDSVNRIMKRDVFPYIGTRPISELEPYDVLAVLRRMEKRVGDSTRRCKQLCGQIFRYAVQSGKCVRDVTVDLAGAIKTPQKRNLAAITEAPLIGDLLRSIEGYQGDFKTVCALKFSPLVFVRPGNVRRAEWSEFDLDAAMWIIPAAKLKLSTEKKRLNLPEDAETVPLSKQAVDILTELYCLTGKGRYVFPSVRSIHRPMSENTVNAALRRLGYDKDTMTAHGFRSMASSQLNELGYRADVIEAALFHKDKNTIRSTYNRTDYLEERRVMMQDWADYLDSLCTGADVIPIHHNQA